MRALWDDESSFRNENWKNDLVEPSNRIVYAEATEKIPSAVHFQLPRDGELQNVRHRQKAAKVPNSSKFQKKKHYITARSTSTK
jgi:hypothetical protein